MGSKTNFKLFIMDVFIILGSICLLYFVMTATGENIYERFQRLPNYNYSNELISLKENGKQDEALRLANYILKNPDMPGQETAQKIKKEIESPLNKAKSFSEGFFSGEGETVSEIAGSITSDLFIYGDVRDLVKQGGLKLQGKETDKLIIGLSALGLIVEAVEHYDLGVASLKTLVKSKLITKNFSNTILKLGEQSVKAKKLDGGLKSILGNTQSIVKGMGFSRGINSLKYVDNVNDLKAISKFGKVAPEATYFFLKNGDKTAIKSLKKVTTNKETIYIMELANKKGPKGVKFVNSNLSLLKFGGKTFVKNNHQNFIIALARKYNFIAIIISILGTIWGVWRLKRRVLIIKNK